MLFGHLNIFNPDDSNTVNRGDHVLDEISQAQENKCLMTRLTLGV